MKRQGYEVIVRICRDDFRDSKTGGVGAAGEWLGFRDNLHLRLGRLQVNGD